MQIITQEIAEQFVRAWQESDNISQVEKRLNISRQAIDYRRQRLIKLGVKLKKFPRTTRGKVTFDINRLNILSEIAANNKCV